MRSVSSSTVTVLLLLLLTIGFFPDIASFVFRLPLRPFTRPGSERVAPCAPSCCSNVGPSTMAWLQKSFTLPARSRGSYLITDHVEQNLAELRNYKVGLLHLFVQHTSCALSLNENWDEDVRADMSDALDRVVPEDRKGNLYRHSAEGPDDMPAHVKSALVGASVSVPIKDGKLALGTWQGIWYLEFRTSKHTRKVVATVQGERI